VLYGFLKHLIIGPLVRLVWRQRVVGLENLPQGAAILAGNHISFIDPVFLAVAVPGPISFLAKSDYFTGRGLRGWMVRRFFLGIRQLPIDRSGGFRSERSLDAGLNHLAAGGRLGIYPEGTRSYDGLLHRGRTGVARLALQSGVPVVPVGIVGTDGVMPEGSTLPRVHPVTITFGTPIDMSPWRGSATDQGTLRLVTEQIMKAIAELSGQERSDTYATRRRTVEPRKEVDDEAATR
jgi:1-acyl-sn-glycerol-3-phosphate acyltransferase